MSKKLLTVAGPEWQTALADAARSFPVDTVIESKTADAAVIALATHPTRYRALALDPAAGGSWLETLLDLTVGDTDHTVPLLILGDVRPAGLALNGSPTLSWPVNSIRLSQALHAAASHYTRPPGNPLPVPFSHVDAIRVRYQPIIRLADLKPTSVEVLARIITSNGDTLGPGAIIDAMTDSNHAMEISSFILKLALAERAIGGFDHLGLTIAFNLPLDALLHPKILPALETIFTAGNIPAEAVKLELTETQPVTNIAELAAVMTRIHNAGYRLALDDITPQTHNLAALLDLPFRAVKLDRSLIGQAQHYDAKISTAAQEFITRITTQAEASKRTVIAEGIENTTTLNLLKSLGATHGQGYHFARPLPARALSPWRTHWRSETGV